ncbi:MAG: type IV pilus modification protein PilV, partial [Nitrospira sp.]|nr:type IV pilus modification protein PilV [Nitrospira sp.]
MTIRLDDQYGFTLIEGLVATAILGVGVLALAGMQAIALARNVDANELTRVTNLASDMTERIQYNRQNVDAY